MDNNTHPISKEYNAALVDGYQNLFIEDNKDAAIISIYMMYNQLIFKISRKNCTDKISFINNCVSIFNIIENLDIKEAKLTKTPLPTMILNFSSLVLIPYKCCNHNSINNTILTRTILVAPIYDCEFSGDEDEEEVGAMINGPLATVNLLNWERAISPKLRMSYMNFSSQSCSRSRIFKIATLKNLYWAIDTLNDSFSFVGFENFKHESFKIILNNKRLSIVPTIDNINGDLKQIVHEILLGTANYPTQINSSEKKDIEAIQMPNTVLINTVAYWLSKEINQVSHFDELISKKNNYTFNNKKKQIKGEVKYSLHPSKYYIDGSSIEMTLHANISNCQVATILNKIGLLCENDCFFIGIDNNRTNTNKMLKFYLAHGIYKDVMSNASYIAQILSQMDNIVNNRIEVLQDVENNPTHYKYPLATSLIILYLNGLTSKDYITQLISVAKNKHYLDADKCDYIINKLTNYFCQE